MSDDDPGAWNFWSWGSRSWKESLCLSSRALSCLGDPGYLCFVAVLCEGDDTPLCSVRSGGTCEKSGLAHAGKGASRRGSGQHGQRLWLLCGNGIGMFTP